MNPELEERIRALERPDPALWKYYILAALPTLIFPPLFLVFLFLGWVRFSTLRYTFTQEGVSMRWGRLFRREIILNYARIQDIHLRSNLVERWLGLSRILVQTASGSAGAEMTIEGLKEYEEVRDFLYSKMRGVSDPLESRGAAPAVSAAARASDAELAETLREVARELELTREAVLAWRAGTPPSATPSAAAGETPEKPADD
jgi:putative membrane protein